MAGAEWTRFYHPEVGTLGELRELRRRRRGANEAQGTTNEAMRFCSRFGLRMIILVYYSEAQHYRVLLPTDEEQSAVLAEHHEDSMQYFTSVARERAAAYVRGYGGACHSARGRKCFDPGCVLTETTGRGISVEKTSMAPQKQW